MVTYLSVIADETLWRAELVALGDIVQDDAPDAGSVETERRFLRYIELLDQVVGDEGPGVFRALIDSMRAEHDYGAYESTLSAALRFAPAKFGAWLFDALPGWIERDPARAGDWLGQLAFLGRESAAVLAFNAAWASTDPGFRDRLLRFVESEENAGWLRNPNQRRVLRPRPEAHS